MTYQNIIVKKQGRIEKIVLNRPHVLNAFNAPMLLELKSEIQNIPFDNDIDIVILTGAGRAFSAGLDIKEAINAGYYGFTDDLQETDATSLIVEVTDMIAGLPQPVIAAINGYAVGGGLEISLVCDIVIASENAAFMDTHARVGILPGAGLSQRLPRLIGSLRAREMIFTNRLILAAEAEQIGLVNKVVPLEHLDRTVDDIAVQILKNNRDIIRQIKSMTSRGALLNLEDGIRLEQEEFLKFRRQNKPDYLNIQIKQPVASK